MKKPLFYTLSIGVLTLISCQNRQPEKSPLEMMVNDYVEKNFPNWDSTRYEGDTLYLHAYFSHYDADPSIKITDSTAVLDVIASVGGAENRMVYPEFQPLVAPPPAPTKDEIDTIEYIDQLVKVIKEAELEIHGKESVAPALKNNKEKKRYYEDRLDDLYREIDTLYLLNPTLIGYTYFGPIQVIILAKHDVDKKIVNPFLKGVNIMDLRPRYIRHKKEEREIDYCGWGSFNVYGIEPAGQFRQVGEFLID